MPEQSEEFAFRNQVKKVGFAQLQHVVALDPKLSDGSYRTFALYLKYAQQNMGCWPSIGRISRDRKKSECTISRHNQELQDLGYITRKRRMGKTTLTIIEDVEQVPRLQSLAQDELDNRTEHCKNARYYLAKMQGTTLQKCNAEEEQYKKNKEKNLGADAPDKRQKEISLITPPVKEKPLVKEIPPVPVSWPQWREFLRSETNKPPALVFMFKTLYPTHDPPSFGYLGKVGNRVGHLRLAEELWKHSARPINGDVLAYIQAIIKGGKEKKHATGPKYDPGNTDDPVLKQSIQDHFAREREKRGTDMAAVGAG